MNGNERARCVQGNDTNLVDSLSFIEEEDLPVIQKKATKVQFVGHPEEIRDK